MPRTTLWADLPSAVKQVIDAASWDAVAAPHVGAPLYAALPTSTKHYLTEAAYNALVQSVPDTYEGAAPLSFAELQDGASAALTFTLTGAAVGRPVAEGWPTTLEAGLWGKMRVSAANTIEVRLWNFTGAALTPAVAQTFRAMVL